MSTFSTSSRQKRLKTPQFFTLLTSKCASRHNGVHFFETRHLSLQKWSEHGVFCTFSLGNVLRATTACTFSKLDISASKSGPNMVCFVHFDFKMCFVPQRRALFRHCNFQKWSENGVFFTLLTSKCASRHNGVHFFETRHLSLQKWSEHGVFCTFSLGNVLRATTACTFSKLDISASKSGPNMVCFVHFDFKMCFVPQRRALFRHCNFQKWSENGVFCTF